jgi:hypothetical protein
MTSSLLCLFFSLAVFWGGMPLLRAEIVCSKDVVCFITEKKEDSVDIYIKTLRTFDITVTIEADLVNMKSSIPLPYTETFPGQTMMKILSFWVLDATKPYRYDYNYYWTLGSMYAHHDESYIYSLPYTPAKSYKVTQGFHGKFSHSGENEYAIDWGMPEGSPVYAAREGVVTGVEDRYSEGGGDTKYRDFSNYVMIKHADGTVGEYDHFQKHGVKVRAGQEIKPGEFLGFSGNVGYSTGPHLHFFVYNANDGKSRRSFPIRFKTQFSDALTLMEGRYYTAWDKSLTWRGRQSALGSQKRASEVSQGHHAPQGVQERKR